MANLYNILQDIKLKQWRKPKSWFCPPQATRSEYINKTEGQRGEPWGWGRCNLYRYIENVICASTPISPCSSPFPEEFPLKFGTWAWWARFIWSSHEYWCSVNLCKRKINPNEQVPVCINTKTGMCAHMLKHTHIHTSNT